MFVAGALALAGCSGADEAVGDCPAVDVCARAPLSAVQAACGTSATASSSSQEATTDPVGTSCVYAVGDSHYEFKVTRQCFKRGAATAARNDLERLRQAAKEPNVAQEDLTGVGQSAVFLYLYGGMEAELYVLQGNTQFQLHDNEAGDDVGASRACLTTLAQSLLAP
jgi:hypothetical protein